MTLQTIGSTSIEPATLFLWDTELLATVEATVLESESGERRFLIRTTKTYRLIKQDAEGRQNWDANLRKLNEYLKDAFSSFRISADYIDSVDGSVTGITDEAEYWGEEAKELVGRRRQLVSDLESTQQRLAQLRKSVNESAERFEERLEAQEEDLHHELESVNADLDSLTEHLYRKRHELGEWKAHGASLAYLFTVSTDATLAAPEEVDQALAGQASEIKNEFYHSVNQILGGENFKLAIQELEEPRIFNRLEYTSLLNPDRLENLKEKNPEFETDLSELSAETAEQFCAYAAVDLEAESGVFEYAKSTPAQAVDSVLAQLEVGQVASGSNAPNDGPMVGTVTGTQQVVGFDPADPSNGLAHLYIVGETGSGKSYTKRVLFENVASLGYDILSISPTDKESIGVSFENPEHDDAQAISADQYWLGNDLLLDEPDDIQELFTGINVVTLDGLPPDEKQGFVDRVFSELYELDGLDRPLYVFLEEAHNFDSGPAAEAIQDIVREARKHGIHVVLASQSPNDFDYSQKHIRQNTSTVFMNGEYTNYAEKFRFLEKGEITELETGQAIFASRDLPKTYVDVRMPLTLAVEPSQEQIKELDRKYQAQVPDVSESAQRGRSKAQSSHADSDSESDETSTRGETIHGYEAGTETDLETNELSEEQEQMLKFVSEYIRENDQKPTYSKCSRGGPFGAKKTKKLLVKLIHRNKLEKEAVTRGGQETEAFGVT